MKEYEKIIYVIGRLTGLITLFGLAVFYIFFQEKFIEMPTNNLIILSVIIIVSLMPSNI